MRIRGAKSFAFTWAVILRHSVLFGLIRAGRTVWDLDSDTGGQMLLNKILAGTSIVIILMIGFSSESHHSSTLVQSAEAAGTVSVAVGPQYDTTDVYVARQDFDRFVTSLTATFGGTTTKQGVFTVTPTPSSTMSQLVLTPVGTISVFGFKTPIPYPFGVERTGYLVKDLDAAVRVARETGADVIVAPFNDAIGRDAIIQWPGRVTPVYSRKSRLCLR